MLGPFSTKTYLGLALGLLFAILSIVVVVVQAISIRIPLSEAFSSATSFSYYLSALLLVFLGGGFLFVWVGNKKLLIRPMAEIQEHALRLASGRERLGETIPEPKVRELRDLVVAFNQMSVELKKTYEEQEQLILDRTKDLDDSNQQLEIEVQKRKNTEEALWVSEERYHNFFDTSRDYVFITSLDGKFIDINDTGLENLGYAPHERDQVIQRDVASFYANPEERQAFTKILSETGFSKDYEIDIRKKDGTIIHTLITAVPRRDSKGTVVGFQGSIRDVTERKRAEKELRQNREELQIVLDSVPALIFYKDANNNLVQANKTCLQTFGYTEHDIIGKCLAEFFTAEQAAEFFRDDLEVITSGHVKKDILEEIEIDGQPRMFLTDKIPYRNPNGDIIGVICFSQDITEQKRAEEALRESERRFRKLVECISAITYEIGADGVFTYVSPVVKTLLGYEPEELIGRHFLEVMLKEDHDFLMAAFSEVGKGVAQHIDHRVIDKYGDIKWVRTLTNAIIEQGSFACARGTLIDITDSKRNEELALQAARLKSVADLSSGVAHHFNNLLQIVMGTTSLSLADLESGNLSEIKTNLERMLEAATLGAETVRRLETFSRVRANLAEGEGAVFNVATTARNAAEVSKPVWKEEPEKKGIKVNLQLDLEDGCLVKGHENEMFEVFVNLIRNAAEALPDGGDIEVKTYTESDEVVISVRDTGTGIAEENLPRVFQPFWSTKGVGIGKGMGLAVTHGLAKRHGGSISVQSKVGAGTTFTVRLPLVQESARKMEAPAMSQVEGNLTILVIDDDQLIASLLERMCAKAGHRVFRALSGQEGLAIFNKELVDLVLCDLGMPGMNGLDVGETIQSICQERGIAKPPFVLLTGWGGQELEKGRIAESGVDAVVAKPLDSATLHATVQEIASRFSLRSRDT